MYRSILTRFGLVVALVARFVATAHAADYVVLVNADNPLLDSGANAQETVKRLFLKELTSWPGGVAAKPLGRTKASPAHAAFVAKVLGMSESELETHWLRLKQTRGETPPREVGSTLILFRQIARDPGAFAPATAEEALDAPPETAVLFRFSD
ncbi:MAG: hypothetical protein ACE5ED_06860 [Rhodothalassiaceae bacterium]